MQTEKKIYVGIGVLVVLAGLIYWQLKRSTREAAIHSDVSALSSATSGAWPEIKLSSEDADKVTKIRIRQAEKPEVTIAKRDDKWWVQTPIAAPANSSYVKQLLDNTKELKIKDVINDTPDAPKVYKDYQIDDDKALHAEAWKGDDKIFDVFFGKSGTRGQMARLASKPSVWVVSGYSSYQFTREVKDWRNKEVLKFEDANVVSVAIRNEDGEFSFTKNDDKWSATYKKKPLERFDPEKIKNLLSSYKNLNADDFADDKPDSDTGLDKPTATVSIKLKDNAGDMALAFGKTSTGSNRYARKHGEKTIYVVGSWVADWAVAKPDKFQKPEDKDAGSDGGGGAKK